VFDEPLSPNQQHRRKDDGNHRIRKLREFSHPCPSLQFKQRNKGAASLFPDFGKK
jgi:hypothetical protein